MRRAYPGLPIAPVVADVGERARVRSLFSSYLPQVVVHAAAHKHVPMMEANPAETIKNNVLAAHLLGPTAGEFGAGVNLLLQRGRAFDSLRVKKFHLFSAAFASQEK